MPNTQQGSWCPAQLTDISIKVPEDVPLYDLNTAAPGLNMPRSKALDKLLQYGEEHMAQLLEDVRFVIGSNPVCKLQILKTPIAQLLT